MSREVTLIQKTNAILKIIAESKSASLPIIQITYILRIDKFPQLNERNLDERNLTHEVQIILNKLIKDGYIDKIVKTSKNNYDGYMITWEGMEFSKKGGYSEGFLDLPAMNPVMNINDNINAKPNALKKWIVKHQDEIIVGVIVSVVAAFLIWVFSLI